MWFAASNATGVVILRVVASYLITCSQSTTQRGWSLWKERNRRIHDRAALKPMALAKMILEEARTWTRAGFGGIASLGCLSIRL
jgi:hypothetical protein